MMLLFTFFFLCAVLTVVSSHICIIEPKQRGLLDISSPGSSSCYLKVGPCGGVPRDNTSSTTITFGEPFTFTYQQNLNHYYTTSPGWFDVYFASACVSDDKLDFSRVRRVQEDFNAMNEISQANFTVSLVVPIPSPSPPAPLSLYSSSSLSSSSSASASASASSSCALGVLQLRYYSNNPLENDRGEVFYQCSDVNVKLPTSTEEETKTSQKSEKTKENDNDNNNNNNNQKDSQINKFVDEDAPSCCTVPQWQVKTIETISYRHSPTTGAIYYDGLNKLMRVDVSSGRGNSIYDGSFRMYLNFTSGLEYYYNVNNNTCSLYGLDYWNQWCYGNDIENETQTYSYSYNDDGDVIDVWSTSPWQFHVNRSSCQPYALTRTSTSTSTSASGKLTAMTKIKTRARAREMNDADDEQFDLHYESFQPHIDEPDSIFAVPDACTRK